MSREAQYDALRARTKAYANSVIGFYLQLQQQYHFDHAALVIGKQLLRSGTSVAANHREARHPRSKADRIAKFHIILEELEKSALWIELLQENNLPISIAHDQLLDETYQLIKIFIASTKSLQDV